MLQKYAGLIAAAGILATVACGQTDAGITTNVKAKLAADDTVKAYQIDVDTRNGVVTLSGEVETAMAKEHAVRVARDTEGVQDVVDQLRVDGAAATGGFFDPDTDPTIGDRVGDAADRAGGAVSDAAITTAVKAKLLADTSVSGLQVDVDTRDGIVTLTGRVSSQAEIDRITTLARNTDGVNNVIVNLQVGRDN